MRATATPLTLPLAETRVTFDVRTPGALKTSDRGELPPQGAPSGPAFVDVVGTATVVSNWFPNEDVNNRIRRLCVVNTSASLQLVTDAVSGARVALRTAPRRPATGLADRRVLDPAPPSRS